MKLPHATVETEGFKSARFKATNLAQANITRILSHRVIINGDVRWEWDALALDEFAEFLTALAKQLRAENKE